MSIFPMVPLEELMATRLGSVDPAKFSDETFELYSIPAYDSRKPEIASGEKIGSTKQIVQPRDVLLSKIVPHIRRSWIVDPVSDYRQIASGEWIVFRSDDVVPAYLRHVLLSDDFHSQFMQTVSGVGGSLLRARPAQVAKIRVPLPPLTEQRRIATILDRADVLRAKRREALAQLDRLAQSIFVEMFGGPESIYAKWPVKPLGELLEFLTSGSRGWAEYYADSGALFLRIQNVRNDRLDLSDVAFVQPPDSAEARRTRVQKGDVLLSITADLGRTAVVSEGLGRAHINQHLSILRTSAIVPRYLSAFLSSPSGQREVLGRNKQGVKAGLNFDDIRSFRIPIPPDELQNDFLALIEKAELFIEANKLSLKHLDALFASLQERAFRGGL